MLLDKLRNHNIIRNQEKVKVKNLGKKDYVINECSYLCNSQTFINLICIFLLKTF